MNTLNRNTKITDHLVVGFAIFATFFGAGNLIFPPALGLNCGNDWFIAFIFYFIADIAFGVMAILANNKTDGDLFRITEPLGDKISVGIISTIVICIGPALVLPRTAAVSYEMGILPLLGIEDSHMALLILSLVYFAAVLVFMLKPGKIVDVVGKILTPVLLLALLILAIKGFANPAAEICAPTIDTPVREGLYNGYQTLDMFAGLVVAVLLIATIKNKGYDTRKKVARITVESSAVASALLFIVYGGLTYLGAGTGSLWADEIADGTMTNAGLLVAITNKLLGPVGKCVLAVVATLACLTTAVSLGGSGADHLEKICRGKISYNKMCVIFCVVSAAICNIGLTQIINISAPILTLIYPLVIFMVATTFLRDKITHLLPYRLGAAIAFIISLVEVSGSTFGITALSDMASALPLSAYGFSWLVPTAAVFIIAAVFTERK